MDEREGVATVVVPDRQLSLAIGKEGQNVRLAAKLTGWRIDIKSASVAEIERLEAAKAAAEEEKMMEAVAEEAITEGIPTEAPEVVESESTEEEEEEVEPLPSLDSVFVASPETVKSPAVREGPRIRFAEDILSGGPAKVQTKEKKKKKKKGFQEADGGEDGVSKRKQRRETEVTVEDDDEL